MAAFLVGTGGGLFDETGTRLDERPVTALAAGPDGVWGVLEDQTLARWEGAGWAAVASLTSHRARCLLPDGSLVGASDARLFRRHDGSLERVQGFDGAEGRETWYTPWGGPPDVRSLSRIDGGSAFANVHVGGILRSDDLERWVPTALDIDTDVHQVLTHGSRVLAASAYGLAISDDAGGTWTMHDDGLHATYARAVAVAGETVLLSASRGHHGREAALYRWDGERFERCEKGLPEWFDNNIDSHCLGASEISSAAGTTDGRVFVSHDAGKSWEGSAQGLPAIRALVANPA